MSRLAKTYRRFLASRRGVAGIEFGMILPILVLMLLAFYDAGTALAIYTKTSFATATLAQITNQYNSTSDPIHDTDMSQIMGATAAVLAPYSSTPSTSNVSQIRINSSGTATVSWSTNLVPGSTFPLPAALAVPNSYLIYATVSYTFTPTFAYFVSGPITLSDAIYVSPRNSASVSRISP
jgi:Flp pilus assembly protein TadG